MCSRYSFKTDPKKARKRFRLHDEEIPFPPPNDDIRPTDLAPLITYHPELPAGPQTGMPAAGFHLALGRFGLVPMGWPQRPLLNARAETLYEKPTFSKLMAGGWHCLVPADAFYEFEAVTGQRLKKRWRFRLKSGEPFALAAVTTIWFERKVERRSFAIITTAANEVVAPIHDRMPVILRPEHEQVWAGPDVITPAAAAGMLAAYPAGQMVKEAV